MPKHTFNENTIREVIKKYLYSVSRGTTPPDVKQLVTEALKHAAPKRNIDNADIATVLSKLAKSPVVNDKIINEVAKEVIDHSAMEDLKVVVSRNAKSFGGKDISDKEAEDIIRQTKLDPFNSSLADIRLAVQKYFSPETQRSLEHMNPDEIEKFVRVEMGREATDREVKKVTSEYLASADPEKPFNANEIRKIIAAQEPINIGIPGQTQIRRPSGPGAKKPIEPQEPPKGPPTKGTGWIPPKDPKNQTFFEKIRLKLHRYGIQSLTRGSRNWLMDNVNKVSKMPNRRKLLAEGETVASAFIGKMFLYSYDAKTKKDLPYWDKFPLIFAIELYKDGWLGINLHYLPIQLRLRLFDRLIAYSNKTTLDKIQKLRLSYQLLKDFSTFPEVVPCIKRYLAKQVKTDLLNIQAIDWEIALFLPVEQFQKESKEHVWKQSKKVIKRKRP